ncbi:MAG: hypothetical protein H6618_06240 [Deltaproteobacteria bacterium]|nr:hypothetical protein [Deltaproteobacteria bacterium]
MIFFHPIAVHSTVNHSSCRKVDAYVICPAFTDQNLIRVFCDLSCQKKRAFRRLSVDAIVELL